MMYLSASFVSKFSSIPLSYKIIFSIYFIYLFNALSTVSFIALIVTAWNEIVFGLFDLLTEVTSSTYNVSV